MLDHEREGSLLKADPILERLEHHDGPELVIALVGAVGTDLEIVSDQLESLLGEVNYLVEKIRLSQLLYSFENWKNLPQKPADLYLHRHMDAGNELRRKAQRGDAMALLAIGKIRDLRQAYWRLVGTSEEPNEPIPRRAYILRSLKHPDEVDTLRNVYGPAFFLVAAYAPRDKRIERLAERIADSKGAMLSDEHWEAARKLSARDEAEAGDNFGQATRKAFPKADVFVEVTDSVRLRNALSRCVELVFGNPFHTPSRDEYGMFHAQAAAMRSADLGRQVGAVIATATGDIVAVGTNDVPKPRGGLYWSDDDPDHRDFRRGFDANDRVKREILSDLLKRLADDHLLTSDAASRVTAIVEGAMAKTEPSTLREATLFSVIEFVRAVHAEMAAIVDAARRGHAVQGCTLYTSTFPCHDCAKHIVAAGIERVVYIEPYPKSRVAQLYTDSVSIDNPEDISPKVKFQPFVGIAPRQYMSLFRQEDGARKGPDGTATKWRKAVAMPRFEITPSAYQGKEFARLKVLSEAVRKAELTVTSEKEQ